MFIRKTAFTYTLLGLISTSQAQHQQADYNRWSLELQTGFQNAVRPYAKGYYSNTANFSNVNLGIRFMTNPVFGLKFDCAYSAIKNDAFGRSKNSLPFHTNYLRSSIQGVVNLHQAWNFQTWTQRLGLQFHGGLGYSTLWNDSLKPFQTGRNMVNFIAGLSPLYKVNERLTLKIDAAFIHHIYQEYTFDLTQTHFERGFDGFMATFTVGAHINLGKQARHADWVPAPFDAKQLKSLEQRLDSLERAQGDNDKDGIPNYMDKEPNTAPGAEVDRAGVTRLPANQRDTDGDGVVDADDLCPEVAGSPAAKGCNDSDGDGVADLLDNCPETAGTPNNQGCPETNQTQLNATGINNILFQYRDATLRSEYYVFLDQAIAQLNSNPSAQLLLVGRADERGQQDYNQKLSVARAEACKRYLIQHGIATERIAIKALGSSNPLYSGQTTESFAGNRSVQLIIQNGK